MSEPSSPRLNRFLASCGLGSRRGCESLILEGRVQVNGVTCRNLATRIGQDDVIVADGRRLTPEKKTTILLHKPPGCICTRSDPQARQTIYDLLPPHLHHLHHVGRLDLDSQGLLILTNCGEITQRLTNPKHKIEKEYVVLLSRPFPPQLQSRLVEGISTPEGFARATSVTLISRRRVCLTLEQGLKRQIRLMFEALGNSVTQLERTRIGSLTDSSLPLGKWRHLTAVEIASIWRKPRGNSS
ncbi:MAG: pseudouridine synthase [Verrucomicrobiales bacterium]